MRNGEKKRRTMTFAGAVQLAAPHTWPAAVFPSLLGAALACADGAALRPWKALTVLFTAVLLQSAVNMLNDYRDFVSGLDSTENCTDPTDAALIYQGVTPRAALALGLTFLLFAALLGGALVLTCGTAMLTYGAAALLAILLYTLPHIAFSGLPFGELLSGITMGGILTCAAYHAQAGTFSFETALLSLPAVLTVGCIMLANNGSDIEKDRAGGRRTLAVCIGRKAAQTLLRCAVAAAALGAAAALLLRFPSGAPAVPVLAAALLLDRNVPGLFLLPLSPERRRESMGGVLAAHSWITGCYTVGAVLECLAAGSC